MASAADVGRVCIKTAGRDAGKTCVIVDVIDDNYVLITGKDVRRRKVNLKHIELLDRVIKIKRGASDEEVLKALNT